MNATDFNKVKFWAKVDIRGTRECWPWLGHIDRNGAPSGNGYGVFWTRRGPRRASHIALELSGRSRPDKSLFALHSCNNPSCVNPSHLRWGSRWDNMVDAFESGTIQRTLTDEEAEAIRNDPRSTSEVAAAFGVSQPLICHIRAGRAYVHKVTR